jgi:hypothetical protein
VGVGSDERHTHGYENMYVCIYIDLYTCTLNGREGNGIERDNCVSECCPWSRKHSILGGVGFPSLGRMNE